jgi:arginase family enzyme
MSKEADMATIEAHLLAPSFSGIDTFWRAPFVVPQQVPEDHVAILGVPNELTISTRAGTRHGPRAIRQHSCHFIAQTRATAAREYVSVANGERVRIPDHIKLVDVGDALLFPNDVERSARSITETSRTIVERGAFPVSLGGDHYISFPLFRGFCAGLRARRSVERFGYIQIDAHLDAASENVVWGRHWHGSNARLIAELLGVAKKNVAWIGINGSTWTDEWEFATKGGACLITRSEVARIGMGAAARKALAAAADGVDAVYLSIDLDVVDVSLSPGVGSVNFGGITPLELLESVEVLANTKIIEGLDIVELCPPLDPSGVTGRLAAAALMTFLAPRLFTKVGGGTSEGQ